MSARGAEQECGAAEEKTNDEIEAISTEREDEGLPAFENA